MSSTLLLPTFGLTAGFGADEDLLLAVSFTLADGVTPVPLPSSVVLTIAGVASLSVAGGQITAMGTAGNVMLVNVPAASKAAWPTGRYPISLEVGDGTVTRNLLSATSRLSIGQPIPPVAIVGSANGALATLQTPAQINALSGGAGAASGSVTHLSANATISAPGAYGLTATALIIRLPHAWPFLAGISIADLTLAGLPGQTITGPIAGGDVRFLNPAQSATFVWDSGLSTFIVF